MSNSAILDAEIADWDYLGATDPFWAVLTDPEKVGGQWDSDAFFRAGEHEIRKVMEWLTSKGITPTKARNSVDFGCGLGRLSKALASYFGQCTGIDASESMLDAARKIHATDSRLRFLLNTTERIQAISDASIDFVYTNIVLQHIPRPYNKRYLMELLRITRPSGLTVFQVPAGFWRYPLFSADRLRVAIHDIRCSAAIRTRLKALLGKNVRPPKGQMQMHIIPEIEVRQIVREAGRQVLACAYSNACDMAFNGNLILSDSPLNTGGFLSRVFVVGDKGANGVG